MANKKEETKKEDEKEVKNEKKTRKTKQEKQKSKTITTLEKQTGTTINGIKTLYKAYTKLPNNNKTNKEIIQQFKKTAEKEYKATTRIVEGRIIDQDEQTSYRSWLQIQDKQGWVNVDITGARQDNKLPYGELLNSKTYMIHEIKGDKP